MKTSLRLLAALFVFLFVARFAAGGDFVSQVVPVGSSFTITVPGDKFLVIRNFTQDETMAIVNTRGTVLVTDKTGLNSTVLTASIMDPFLGVASQEPVDEIVIGGPATVKVTGGDTTCFITYRKGQD
jgi:hypothetical protein